MSQSIFKTKKSQRKEKWNIILEHIFKQSLGHDSMNDIILFNYKKKMIMYPYHPIKTYSSLFDA